MRLELHVRKSPFLADINNEREAKNATYVARLGALTNLVLVRSTVDTVIIPRASAWFVFYRPNSTKEIEPLAATAAYRDLGLSELEATGRLHFAECDCKHVQLPTRACRLAVWERGSKRYLEAAGALGWLQRLLYAHHDDDEDDDEIGRASHAPGRPSEPRPLASAAAHARTEARAAPVVQARARHRRRVHRGGERVRSGGRQGRGRADGEATRGDA